MWCIREPQREDCQTSGVLVVHLRRAERIENLSLPPDLEAVLARLRGIARSPV
ncbi:MAG: hypothetical protein HYY06_10395 [Deltaproteobacteria bacterium]|nr:hypothetical protein [Deltaproteobacteria bacterium]